MAKKELVSLGFMSYKMSGSEVAEIVKAITQDIARSTDVKLRVTVILSGQSQNGFGDLAFVDEFIRKKRTAISNERHRLLGAGFLEEADRILVCDLDYGYAPQVISRFVSDGIVSSARAIIPQPKTDEVEANSWTLDELARAFENYLVSEAAGTNFPDHHGMPAHNFQTGMYLFRREALCELFKRHWMFENSFWDLEVVMFLLQAGISISYPRMDFILPRGECDTGEARLRIETLMRSPSGLSYANLPNHFEAFYKRYAHLIRTEVGDKYRDKVFNPVTSKR